MKKINIFFILLLICNLFFSQEEESICGDITDPKIQKLIEKAKNSKKYDYKERVAFYKEAIEYDDDECIQCMWNL